MGNQGTIQYQAKQNHEKKVQPSKSSPTKSEQTKLPSNPKKENPFMGGFSGKEYFVNQAPISVDLRNESPTIIKRPFFSSCKVIMKYAHPRFASKCGYASGVVISENVILTVGHNLWKKEIIENEMSKMQVISQKLTAQKILIEIQRGQSFQNGDRHTLEVKEVIIHPMYEPYERPQLTQRDPCDIAILILKPNSYIKPEHCIDIKWDYAFDLYKNNIIKIIGYPNITPTHDKQHFEKKKARQYLFPYLAYTHCTSAGNSGSPVFVEIEDSKNQKHYQLIGLHKGTTINLNFCIMLNLEQNKEFLEKYLEIDGSRMKLRKQYY